jgi:hypothetical protein
MSKGIRWVWSMNMEAVVRYSVMAEDKFVEEDHIHESHPEPQCTADTPSMGNQAGVVRPNTRGAAIMSQSKGTRMLDSREAKNSARTPRPGLGTLCT